MITWIGLCAGEVWRYLDRHDGKASLGELYTQIEAPRETILMAVGWLSREGFVLIDGNLPDFHIRLNPCPPGKNV